MADPVVHITNGVPDSGTGNITTLGQHLSAIQTAATSPFAKVTDGTSTAAVKAASTAPAATDPALVVAISPNSVNANGSAASASSAPVVIASDQAAVAIKAASGALASGSIATGAIASGAIASGAAVSGAFVAGAIADLAHGQAAMAASVPVAIANNQSTLAIAQDTANIADGATGTNLTPLFATIVASASGATTIVAAVGGKKIRVLSWYLKANAAVNFKWQSHVTPTDLTGLFYNGAQGDGVGAAFSPVGHFQTISGEALDINLSGAVAVGGYLVYVTV
jgi:hypothetical protein